MSHVLIISHDRVAPKMAGVGIRYFEIARALCPEHRVTLAAPLESSLPSGLPVPESLHFYPYDPEDLSSLDDVLGECNVVFAYPDTLWRLRHQIDKVRLPMAVDGYDITLLEHLHLDEADESNAERIPWHLEYLRMNEQVARRGDFFLAATERQRDWWLGCLAASGRINPLQHRMDPSFRNLIDLLPYGVPDSPPQHTRNVLRGVQKGISENDRIVLWGGGIWEWLDPLTLLQAAARIARTRTDVKFVFPGVSHPAVQIVKPMRIQQRAWELAHDLDLMERIAFFGDWVAYEDWGNYLLESDVAVSLHFDHLEARMSARTRILSYVWAGLPMVLTEGDELASRMAASGVAKLTPEADAVKTAAAVLEMLDAPRTRFKDCFQELRQDLGWSRAVAALSRFCHKPRRATDAMIFDLLPVQSEPSAISTARQAVREFSTEEQGTLDMPTFPHASDKSLQNDAPAPADLASPSETNVPVSSVQEAQRPLDRLLPWRRIRLWKTRMDSELLGLRANIAAIQQQLTRLPAMQQQLILLTGRSEEFAGVKSECEAYLMRLQEELNQLLAVIRAEVQPEMRRSEQRLTDLESLQTDLAAAIARLRRT